MYNVFLVDDEELVIKSLIASVDWSSYGFQVAGYALSGIEALERIALIQPDIVFTDIRMPGISGLELIKQLNDASCPALMIVISGYAEFALAQKAINYGAFGYCLKPFDEAEIISFLKKAKGVLQERILHRELDFLAYLESDRSEDRTRLIEVIRSHGIDPEVVSGMKVIVSIGTTKWKSVIPLGITFRIGLEKYAYLIPGNSMAPVSMITHENIAADIKGIGLSNCFSDFNGIRRAIREAEINAYKYFVTGKRLESIHLTERVAGKENILKGWEDAITKRDVQSVNSALDQLAASFKGGELQIQDALHIFNQTMLFINRDEGEIFEDYIYSFDQLASSFDSVQEMLAYLRELLTEKYKQTRKGGQQHAGNRTFKAICSYIDEHYREELSIPSLSRLFNVNGNYISQLFRKETGSTFTEYVTSRRIEYACEILRNTDLTISEVADKAGYSDYFYFSRIFKRNKGITPSAYRSRS